MRRPRELQRVVTGLEREIRDRLARGQPLQPMTLADIHLHLDEPDKPPPPAPPARAAEQLPGATVWNPPLQPFEWRTWSIDPEWSGRDVRHASE